MILFLIGYMASGKTTIGKMLSKKLGYTFIDLDDYIVSKENKTVNDIFKSKGEIYFRKRESQLLNEIIENNDDLVLSLGGGTPCYGNNLELLLNVPNTRTIYLKASIKTLAQRLIKEKKNRPLISHLDSEEELMEFIGKHLFERSQYYGKTKLVISIDDKTEQDIVDAILKLQ
jgi:shikimate kinase